MILVDANLLVYACAPMLPLHERARAWLDARLNGPGSGRTSVGEPSRLRARGVESAHLQAGRDHRRSMGPREEWLGREQVWIPVPTERHQSVVGPFLRRVVDRPKLVPDAHLAILTVG